MLFQKEVNPIVNCAAIRLFFKELECHQLEFKKAMLRLKTTRRVDIQWGKIEFLVPLHTASSFFLQPSQNFLFREKVYPLVKEATALRGGGTAARIIFFQRCHQLFTKVAFQSYKLLLPISSFYDYLTYKKAEKSNMHFLPQPLPSRNTCQIINPHFKLPSRSVQSYYFSEE